jgi:CO dehydrogenase maturation factor
VRGIIRELGKLEEDGQAVTIVDMEAGLEHLKRGTPSHTDALVVVAEPYFRSLETALRTAEMGQELGIPRVGIVANKIRDERDEGWARQVFEPRGYEILGTVPFDQAVTAADRAPGALLDVAPESMAVQAVAALADRLDEMGAVASGNG